MKQHSSIQKNRDISQSMNDGPIDSKTAEIRGIWETVKSEGDNYECADAAQ